MNKFIIIGRTTKDIELKKTNSGTAVASFSVAVKRNFKNGAGEYESDFFNCVAFNKQAEMIANYVHKGDMIGVEGRVQTRNYTDKDGNNRYATEVMVDNIDFLQPKKQEATKKETIELKEVDPFGELPF